MPFFTILGRIEAHRERLLSRMVKNGIASEYLLSECGSDAVLYHPREEALAVGFDPAVSSKGGHIAAQLVGLARRIIRDLDGELHHLLLKDRDAERALQDLFEARMSINDGLFSVATP